MKTSWSWAGGLAVEDVLQRPVTNVWTAEQRLSLMLLRRFYDNSWTDIAQIFNVLFKSQLEDRGFGRSKWEQKISKNALRTQWHHAMKNCMEEYETVYLQTLFDDPTSGNSQISSLHNQLRCAARKARVSLSARTSEDVNITRNFRLFSSNREAICERAMVTQDTPALCTSFVPASNSTRLNEAEQAILPPLLFRVYDEMSNGVNSSTGFQATASAISSRGILDAPSLYDCKMLDYADTHLNYWKEEPSFLISTSSSLIWMLHMAQVLRLRGGTPQISVIDTRKVANRTRVYPAKVLCELLKMEGKAKWRYQGQCEYLVWQQIREEAILADFLYEDLTSLCRQSIPLTDLLRLDVLESASNLRLKSFRGCLKPLPLTHTRGFAIGEFASFLRPDPFLEAPWVQELVEVVIQNWKLTSNCRWLENSDFVDGLRLAMRKSSDPRLAHKFAGIFIPPRAGFQADCGTIKRKDRDESPALSDATMTDACDNLVTSAEAWLFAGCSSTG